MPEYGVELPIWSYEWHELNLDPSLLHDLANWQATFDANFDPERCGWLDDDVRTQWAAESERLVARLRAALPAGIRLVVDLWPLDPI